METPKRPVKFSMIVAYGPDIIPFEPYEKEGFKITPTKVWDHTLAEYYIKLDMPFHNPYQKGISSDLQSVIDTRVLSSYKNMMKFYLFINDQRLKVSEQAYYYYLEDMYEFAHYLVTIEAPIIETFVNSLRNYLEIFHNEVMRRWVNAGEQGLQSEYGLISYTNLLKQICYESEFQDPYDSLLPKLSNLNPDILFHLL